MTAVVLSHQIEAFKADVSDPYLNFILNGKSAGDLRETRGRKIQEDYQFARSLVDPVIAHLKQPDDLDHLSSRLELFHLAKPGGSIYSSGSTTRSVQGSAESITVGRPRPAASTPVRSPVDGHLSRPHKLLVWGKSWSKLSHGRARTRLYLRTTQGTQNKPHTGRVSSTGNTLQEAPSPSRQSRVSRSAENRPHKATQTSHSNTPDNGPAKRRASNRNGEDADPGENSDDSDGSHPDRKRPRPGSKGKGAAGKPLVCPYFLRHVSLVTGVCRGPGFKSKSDLKYHLWQVHLQHDAKRNILETDAYSTYRLRGSSATNKCKGSPELQMGHNEWVAIHKTFQGASNKRHVPNSLLWIEHQKECFSKLWEILFRGEPKPSSPFFEDAFGELVTPHVRKFLTMVTAPEMKKNGEEMLEDIIKCLRDASRAASEAVQMPESSIVCEVSQASSELQDQDLLSTRSVSQSVTPAPSDLAGPSPSLPHSAPNWTVQQGIPPAYQQQNAYPPPMMNSQFQTHPQNITIQYGPSHGTQDLPYVGPNAVIPSVVSSPHFNYPMDLGNGNSMQAQFPQSDPNNGYPIPFSTYIGGTNQLPQQGQSSRIRPGIPPNQLMQTPDFHFKDMSS